MQILVQYTSELVTAIGILLATLLLVRFTLNRIKQLPEKEKILGRPLWVSSIGIFFMGIASLSNYALALFPSAIVETMYYLFVAIGAGIFALSATMIIGWKKGQVLPIFLMSVRIVFIIAVYSGNGLLDSFFGTLTVLSTVVLFAIPFILYTYLTVKTRRVTSFGFAVLALTYPFMILLTSFATPEIVALVIAVRVYGPALLITALVLPKTDISVELMVYALTVGSLFYFMSYLLVSPAITDIVVLITVTFIAVAAALSVGSSAYTITRWRSSHNQSTLTLGIYFIVGGLSFLLVALSHVGFIAGLNSDYIALVLGITAPMLLNLSAILALDWKRVLLLPALIFAAPMFQIIVYWPQGFAPELIPGRTPVMAITGILQSIIPLALYGLLWWRMRKGAQPGRSRALFLALGIVMLIFGTAGGNVVTLISSLFIFSAFFFWWIGITGRADQLLNTATI